MKSNGLVTDDRTVPVLYLMDNKLIRLMQCGDLQCIDRADILLYAASITQPVSHVQDWASPQRTDGTSEIVIIQ